MKIANTIAISSTDACIGRTVVKRSGKPFKSGQFTAVVSTVTTNPQHNHRPAFTFIDCDGVVDVTQLLLLPSTTA